MGFFIFNIIVALINFSQVQCCVNLVISEI